MTTFYSPSLRADVPLSGTEFVAIEAWDKAINAIENDWGSVSEAVKSEGPEIVQAYGEAAASQILDSMSSRDVAKIASTHQEAAELIGKHVLWLNTPVDSNKR